MLNFKSIFALLPIIGLMFGTAQAQISNNGGPIHVAADAQEFENDNSVWTGHVQIVQNDAILTADKVKLVGVQSELNRFVATGNVRFTNPDFAVSGNQAIYEDSSKTITVTGNVVILQGEQVLAGEKLVYNTETEAVQIFGNGSKRVRGIFYQQEGQQVRR